MAEILDFTAIQDVLNRIFENARVDRNYHECHMCFNSGWAPTYRQNLLGVSVRGVVRCDSCDHWIRRKAVE